MLVSNQLEEAMKNYLIIGVLVVVSIVGIWLLAARSDDRTGQSTVEETALPQEPESFDPAAETSETMQYISQQYPVLRLSYPTNWNVTEGADNSPEQQLVTFESPKDANNYYFCLDLTEVSVASDLDFATSGANISAVDSFMAEGINKDLSSVIFNVEEGGNLLWSLIDGSADTSQGSFANEITSPNGRRLQTLGRFNCRETDSRVSDHQEFTNSRWFNQAQAILRSLSY
jgi:hypothetical protein